jgi:orotate phosphoribosyltransferase
MTTKITSNLSLTELKENLLELFCQYAYKEGDFVLSSGQRSSYYINGKEVTLRAEGALAIGRIIFSLLPEDTDGVAGLTLGADPLVTAVSVVSALENKPIPALIIRKQAKGHGTQAYVEGPSLSKGAKIVVLEDVVTTGRSAMDAVERLKNVGYEVTEIITLVDRQQGGAEFYQSQNLKFRAVFSLSELQNKAKQLK